MPSYYYHIKFEVYPTSSPTSGETGETSGLSFWVPERTSDIFDNLPSHPPRTRTQTTVSSGKARSSWRRDQTATTQAKAKAKAKPNPDVIDCGTPRPPEGRDERTIVRLSERQRTLSFPPPQPDIAINPRIASKDWRFGQLRIESIDVGVYPDRSIMQATSAAAAAVGPSMGGAGKATKAKYVPLTTSKNTELGWGIVHLYKEEAESPELTMLPDPVPGAEEEQDESQIDCTTVCIPAVPSYLSPSDFLGFVGEKWWDQISHYRMVMTGRMNRYLVLMKFRETKQAQLFRRDFDGKVFNNVEVMPSFFRSKVYVRGTNTQHNIARDLYCCLHQVCHV